MLKSKIKDSKKFGNRYHKSASNGLYGVYFNEGVLKDAVRFNLAESDGDKNPGSLLAEIAQKIFSGIFYLAFILPFFFLYYIISSVRMAIVRFLKKFRSTLKRVNKIINQNSLQKQKPLIYNP